MTKKKLLIVADNFLPRWDGVARFLVEVLPKLSQHYDITVLAPDFAGSATSFPDVEIVRFKLSPLEINGFPLAYPNFKKVKPYVKKADIIFAQTVGPMGTPAIYYAKKYLKPLVSYAHSIDWVLVERSVPGPNFIKTLSGWISKKFAVWLYNKCDIIMMPTQEVGDIFEEAGIESVKTLVPLGVNIEKFTPPKDKGEAKVSIGLHADDLVIGYCGRVTRDKDVMTLYKSFEWLNKKVNNLKLLIVGPGLKGYLDLFESKLNVVATGPKDDVIPYYQAMDIYVQPSLTETTGLSTLEAMSCGCAVAATKVGIAQIIIRNNENGLFFPKRNTMILKKKLQWLSTHKDRIELFGQRARNSVVKHFSWNSTIKGIESVLAKFE